MASLTLQLIARTAGFDSSLKQSQKQFSAFQKRVLGDARAFKKIGTEFKQIGTSLTLGLTAPIVALGIKGAASFRALEKEMLQVRAVATGTEKDFKNLEDQAKSLGITTKFSATQAGQGMGFLGQAGFDATEIFEAMPAVLSLAAAANLDVAQSADIASNIIAGFGLETKDLAEANDILVKTMISSNTNLEQLGEAMKKAGPFASEMGLELSEVAAILGTMGNAGIQAEEAGTALNRALVNLAVPTGETANVIAEFDLQVRNIDGSMKSFADVLEETERKALGAEDIIRLFGVRAGPKLLKVVRDGSTALRTFSAELKNSGGEADRVAKEKLKGLDGAITKMTSAIEGAFIALGTGLAPKLIQMADLVRGLAADFAKLDQGTQEWIIGIATGLALGGPVLIGLGFLLTSISSIAPLIATVFFGPIGIISAIVALGIWLVIATGNWDAFAESIKKTTSALEKNIEQHGILKTAMAGVLNTLNFNIFGYERYLELLSDPKGAEGVEKITESFEDNAKAASTAMFALGSGVEIATESVEDLIDVEGARQALMGEAILLEAQLDRKRELQANAEANRQEALGRIWQKRGEKRVANEEKWARRVGSIQEDLGRKILADAQAKFQDRETAQDLSLEVQKQAAQGFAAVLKSIWTDNEISASDAFKNAANVFVDVMAQMLAEAIFTSRLIQVQMAAATFGISVVVGLLVSTFSSGRKGGKSELQKATEDFLKEIKRTIKAFEDEILTVLQKTTLNAEKSRDALNKIVIANKIIRSEQDDAAAFFNPNDASGINKQIKLIESLGLRAFTRLDSKGNLQVLRNLGEIEKIIIENAKESLGLIKEEFRLKKEFINEIFGLLKREASFVKDIDKTITGVRRAFFSQGDLFEAQKKDIQDLTGLVAVASGESKLELISDLKQAYLDSFETAKSLFEGDPEKLKSWQQEVLSGLAGVKDSGKDAFQDLVDVQLKNLSIQEGLKVTQESMERHLSNINNATIGMTLALQSIAEGDTSQKVLDMLTQNASTLFPSSPITQLAHGGIVTKPTFAMIGEGRGPEAVIPLEKAGQFGFGGGGSVTIINKISLPNVRDIRDLSVPQVERLITGKFDQAMRNLNRHGHILPIKAKK